MTIILYNNASPTNKAVKDLTQVASYDGYLREGTSIVNPHIMIEQSTLPSFNYASIEAFSRKYFVESVVNVNNNLWEVVLHCDVLSTYWNSIKEADCIVSRSETKRIDKLIDNQIWTTADSLYGVKQFPNKPFAKQTGDIERYVMIVAGSGSYETSSSYSVAYTPPTGYHIRSGSISLNGISYDSNNHQFWIPNSVTATTFSFVVTAGQGDTYTVTATDGGSGGTHSWTFN